MEELKLEFTCIYVRHYNLIWKTKEAGTFQPQHLSDLRAQVEPEKNDKFKQVVEHYPGFSTEIVNHWITKNLNNPTIKKQISELDKLYDDVYVHQRITDLGYQSEIPERMTRERYIRIYRKIFATLRHDLYVKLMDFKRKQPGIQEIPEQLFDQLWGETWKTFEDARVDIFNLMMEKKGIPYQKADRKVAKRVM